MRRDPLLGEWILYSPERAARPANFRSSYEKAIGSSNPFAVGNEPQTTPEILAVREPGSEPNGAGWLARVILNKYPAVSQLPNEGEPEPPTNATASSGFFESRPVFGRHDVIVESPQELSRFHELSVDDMRKVFGLYRARWRQLSDDPGLAYAILFKNEGPMAGASLEHVHSQCLGLPFVPAAVERQLAAAAKYRYDCGRNFFDDFLREELAAGTRILAETEHFVSLCPFFSRFPYETWIVPRRAEARFEHANADEIAELAAEVHRVLNQMQRIRAGMPFNFMLQSAPFQIDCDESFRWYFQITPRLSQLAGLELGSGQLVNLVLPEEAARQLNAS